MRHYVNLRYGNCWLRPELRGDCDRILQLWNNPYVVGNLWMSKTSPETFLKFYDKYEKDEASFSWVICTLEGKFVGTIGISCITANDCVIGRFAMEKDAEVPIALPQTLIKSFVFDALKLERIKFTVNVANKRIKRFHQILGAVNEGVVEAKAASCGGMVTLEHWHYNRSDWNMSSDLVFCQ